MRSESLRYGLACVFLVAGAVFFTACDAGFKGRIPGVEGPVSLTGTVVITGTPQVGQVLTADVADLGGSGDISFQWKRGSANVGTDGDTYVVQAADVGSTITVTVIRANNSGSVTSASVGPVTPAGLPALTGTVSITGTPQVGQTLTANTASLGGSGTMTFQWRRGGINVGTNSSTYVVQAADVGSMITVTVIRANNSGTVASLPVGPVTAIAWTAVAVGDPTTTDINFTFSAAPAGLLASDITITSGTGSATSGVLSGTGTTRSLAITSVSAGTVSISINRAGIASGPQTVTLVAPQYIWLVGGTMPWTLPGTPMTRQADGTFTWEGDLEANSSFRFSLTYRSGLDGWGGGSWIVPEGEASVPVYVGGTVPLRVVHGQTTYHWIIPDAGRYRFTVNPETMTLCVVMLALAEPDISWTAVAVGSPTTTAIYFTFNAVPAGLVASDITIASGTGSATRSVLFGAGTTRLLAVTGVSAGTVSVSINRAGIASGPQTVTLVGPRPVVSPGFVRIQGGTFLMGWCPTGQNVTPMRYVTLSGFYMSRFQVTQGEWYDVMGSNPSWFNQGHWAIVAAGVNWRNLPVEHVSWYDALVFSNRLSILRGLTPAYSIGGNTNPDDWGPVPNWDNWDARAIWDAVVIVPGSTGYRLPTEAQWEFAARGGIVCQGNFVFSGSDNAAEVAWTRENSGNRTHEVGLLMPNALGLYDMSGNVWEWIWDWSGSYPSEAETDPVGPAAGGYHRVGRGGSWDSTPADVRSAHRFNFYLVVRGGIVGFRVVRP